PLSVKIPVIRKRVVCGVFDVMLIFAPTSAFNSVDFPTDGRPTIAICPASCAAAALSVIQYHGAPAVETTLATAAAAAFCSAARRLAPVPRAVTASAGMRQSTSNCCACASPLVPTTAYSGNG